MYAIQERAVSENINNGPQGLVIQERIAYMLEARHHVQTVAYRTTGNCGAWETGDKVDTLTTGTDRCSHVLAYGGGNTQGSINVATTLTAKAQRLSFDAETPLLVRRVVRRLTPRECERLMGLDDDYTLITHRGKPAADGPRYRAIGNSIAIPDLRWIGRRILNYQQ